MLIIDVIFAMLIPLLLFGFSILFHATVEKRYEVIQGGLSSDDATLELLSILKTEHDGSKASDDIVDACSSNPSIAKELFNNARVITKLTITCPNKQKLTIGESECIDYGMNREKPTKKMSLVAQDANIIIMEYC